jgi:adenylosuccinate synthase
MNKAVIGLGFGDEGKGLVVDYLCSKSPDSLVVRYCGGHQVGHTVVHDGIRHVFSNFGSGALRGSNTYWSKFCTVEPVGLIREADILKEHGKTAGIFIDERCPITTPWDIYHNREKNHKTKHGSVGVGFGSTIQREENFYSLTFLDLFYEDIFNAKLQAIAKYYGEEEYNPVDLENFIDSCCKIPHRTNIIRVRDIPKAHDYIYEGSQGLLLDQHYGFFPNVTRSNTGTKNILALGDYMFEVFLVTRAYQTRHGNGFMTNEGKPHNIKSNPMETNKLHPYQGEFRRSLLDLSLLEYAIAKDEYVSRCHNKNLVITCLDHIESDYRFTYEGSIYGFVNEEDFVLKISKILKIRNIYLSHSEDSKNITHIQL